MSEEEEEKEKEEKERGREVRHCREKKIQNDREGKVKVKAVLQEEKVCDGEGKEEGKYGKWML